MNIKLGNKNLDSDEESTVKDQCLHSKSVKIQQLESEKRWITMHRLFDR